LSTYGIDSIVDAAIPTSGPTHADISKGCLEEPGYGYDNADIGGIDLAYGFPSGGGPCAAHDPSFTNIWIADSTETGGINYNYPNTRIHLIVGEQDKPAVINRVNDYYQVLLQAQQPLLTKQVVPRMSHTIQQDPNGLPTLLTALTATG